MFSIFSFKQVLQQAYFIIFFHLMLTYKHVSVLL